MANPLEYVTAHPKRDQTMLGISYQGLQHGFIGQANKGPRYPESKEQTLKPD